MILLARLVIAKITDEDGLISIFRSTPAVQNDPEWRCRHWVAEVLRRIREDCQVVGTAQLDWAVIEREGRNYVLDKKSQGRYGAGADVEAPKPTLDLLGGKETIP